MKKKLLKIPEVAEILDVRVGRAYELAREGILPSVRIGRQVRVHPEELDEWLRSGGSETTPSSTVAAGA